MSQKFSKINFFYDSKDCQTPFKFSVNEGNLELNVYTKYMPDFLSPEFYELSKALIPFSSRFDELYDEVHLKRWKKKISKYHFDSCTNFNREYNLETIPYNFRYGESNSRFNTVVLPENHISHLFKAWNPIEGGKVLVLGNSPAIQEVDLNEIRKHSMITIGVNRICRSFEPDFLVFSDKEILFSEYEEYLKNFNGVLITNAAVYNNYINDGKKYSDLKNRTVFYSFEVLNEKKQESCLLIKELPNPDLLGTINFIERKDLGLQILLTLNDGAGSDLLDDEFDRSMTSIQNIIAAISYYTDTFKSGPESFPKSFHNYLRTVRSSTAMALQIAYLCNPTEIGMLGVDFSTLSSKRANLPTHFYGINKSVGENNPGDSNEFMRLNFMRELSDLLDKKEIPFYNLSPFEDTPINKIGLKKKKFKDFF